MASIKNLDNCYGATSVFTFMYLALGFPHDNGVVCLHCNGVSSSSQYYGIVQIWYNGQWDNICDDSYYDQHEADVIRHQLGYIGASNYSRAGLMKLVPSLILYS